jgi:hypothetical protein
VPTGILIVANLFLGPKRQEDEQDA